MTRDSFDFGAGPVPAHRHPNGNGWVADTAKVAATAYVGDEARIYGEAWVYGEACVYGKAHVYGEAWVYDKARIYGEAWVYDKARIYGEARVSETPIMVCGYEYLVCIVDNCLLVGCKAVRADEPLAADLWPEEICPRLRRDAPLLIKLAEAHWAECAK